MELRHLRYFLAVAECGSITHAAERLYVAQPALSRQIRRLEREAGELLLIRKARGVDLTEAGLRMVDRARAAVATFDSILAPHGTDGRPAVGRPGTLRIGVQCAGLAELTPIVAAALRSVVSGFSIDFVPLSFRQLFTAADTREFDVILGTSGLYPDHADVSFTPVLVDPLVALVARDSELAAADAVDLADIVDEVGLPVRGAPGDWAAPLLLAGPRNGESGRVAVDCESPTDIAHAMALTRRMKTVTPSAASDRLLPGIDTIKQVRIRGADPLLFGIYLFGSLDGDATRPLHLVRDIALRVSGAFSDLVHDAVVVDSVQKA